MVGSLFSYFAWLQIKKCGEDGMGGVLCVWLHQQQTPISSLRSMSSILRAPVPSPERTSADQCCGLVSLLLIQWSKWSNSRSVATRER